MSQSQPPPPGWVPPTAAPPGPAPHGPTGGPSGGQVGAQVGGPVGGYPGAYGFPPLLVHKPGVVALRPLGLGDLYDGAFKTIRRSPGAMIGLSALVTTAFLLVPVLVTLALAASGNLSSSLGDPSPEVSGQLATALAQYLGPLFGLFATALLNGLVVHVVSEAVLGRRTTMAQAWRAVRGRFARLVGLVLLNLVFVLVLVLVPVGLGVLVGFRASVGAGFLVGVPLFLLCVVTIVFVEVRYFLLAPAVLVLERVGVGAALRRAGGLSGRQWWRLFGIQLLTGLLVGVVGEVISVPFGLVGVAGGFALSGTGAALVLVFSGYLSQVIVGSLTTPFTSGVTALQYVDQRIRKEALDVQLIAAAQRQAERAV